MPMAMPTPSQITAPVTTHMMTPTASPKTIPEILMATTLTILV